MTTFGSRRHTRLHDALVELAETHELQEVEIPPDKEIEYYRKYAHTLAQRWGMQVVTRILQGRMFIAERRAE